MTETIGYAFMVADLFHYGHLNFLRECKHHCDFLIVGIYTDELTVSYKRRPIIPFRERRAIMQTIKLVDLVVTVHNRSCIPMLKKLFELGLDIKYLFHGTDWNAETDEDLKRSKAFIESMGGELIQPQYYEDRSTSLIIEEIARRTKGAT